MNAPAPPLPQPVPDPRWGEGGWVELPPIPGFDRNQVVNDAALQRDGKLLVCMTASLHGRSRYAVHRFTARGAPDPTFGNRGWICGNLLDDSNGVSGALGLALQWDETSCSEPIVLLGWRERFARPGSKDLLVTRFQPSGLVDPGFGYRGRALLPAQEPETLLLDGHRIEADEGALHVQYRASTADRVPLERLYSLPADGDPAALQCSEPLQGPRPLPAPAPDHLLVTRRVGERTYLARLHAPVAENEKGPMESIGPLFTALKRLIRSA